MKNINFIHILLMLFLPTGICSSAYAEDYKLGAVNAIRVLEQSPQADAARAIIEKEFAPRGKELDAAQKVIKELEDRLAKDAEIMSEPERDKLERDIISKKRDLKRTQDEFRDDFNFRRNEEFAKIQKQIVEAIQKVAKDNNYDVVLSEGIIYASPKADISDLIIEYLKNQGKESGQ